jgi:hypothetical protein
LPVLGLFQLDLSADHTSVSRTMRSRRASPSEGQGSRLLRGRREDWSGRVRGVVCGQVPADPQSGGSRNWRPGRRRREGPGFDPWPPPRRLLPASRLPSTGPS